MAPNREKARKLLKGLSQAHTGSGGQVPGSDLAPVTAFHWATGMPFRNSQPLISQFPQKASCSQGLEHSGRASVKQVLHI